MQGPPGFWTIFGFQHLAGNLQSLAANLITWLRLTTHKLPITSRVQCSSSSSKRSFTACLHVQLNAHRHVLFRNAVSFLQSNENHRPLSQRNLLLRHESISFAHFLEYSKIMEPNPSITSPYDYSHVITLEICCRFETISTYLSQKLYSYCSAQGKRVGCQPLYLDSNHSTDTMQM